MSNEHQHDHASDPGHNHEDEHAHEEDCCGHEHQHEHGAHKTAPESIALNPDAKGNLETTLRVAGMDCADEVEALERVFRPLKGVREVRVNLILAAEAPAEQLLIPDPRAKDARLKAMQFEFERTASRLVDMQSLDYLTEARRTNQERTGVDAAAATVDNGEAA